MAGKVWRSITVHIMVARKQRSETARGKGKIGMSSVTLFLQPGPLSSLKWISFNIFQTKI
jgi:hypothetical protein